jgi:two-component system nitrogen regulation response regulator GlnG
VLTAWARAVLAARAFDGAGAGLSRDAAAHRLLRLVDVDTREQDSANGFQTLVDTAVPTLVREMAAAKAGNLYRSVMARIERPLLRQALEIAGGNQLKAARLLGINRNTLRKRLRLLGLRQLPAGNGAAED